MNRKEIEQLYKRMDKRVRSIKPILENDTTALAQITKTDGWAIIEQVFDEMITELLEPEDMADMSAEAYQVSGEARRLTLHTLRTIMEQIETAKQSEIAMKR